MFYPPKSTEVIYHPPKSSSFGHSATSRNPRKGWTQTKHFLETVTNYSLRDSVKLNIHCYPKWSDPILIEKCTMDAIEIFGPANKRTGELSNTWHVPLTRIDEAIEFAMQDIDRPIQEIGPTRLHFCFDLTWKQHQSLSNVTDPGLGSHIGITLGGRRLFIQPTLRFPFQEVNRDLLDYLAYVQCHLPFKFRENCFKLFHPTKDGKSGIGRKLGPGWLAI